jgi:Protein of unknown function (DUF3102)
MILTSTALQSVSTNVPDAYQYAERIVAACQKSVESIIEAGRLLIEARERLDDGEWLKLVDEIPFSSRTAQRLMAIARNPIVTTHVSRLPPSWGTLYEMTRMPPATLREAIEAGKINPDTERKDVARICRKSRSVMVKRRSLEHVKAMRHRIEELEERCEELQQERDLEQERLQQATHVSPLLAALHAALDAIDNHRDWPAGEPRMGNLRVALEDVIALMQAAEEEAVEHSSVAH